MSTHIPMRWLLDNPQIIVFAAFFVIVTLANRSASKKAKAAKEARLRQPPNSPAATSTNADTDEARARQVQEEIRRKILARMAAADTQQTRRAPMPRPTDPDTTLRTQQTTVARTDTRAVTRTDTRAIPRADAQTIARTGTQTITRTPDRAIPRATTHTPPPLPLASVNPQSAFRNPQSEDESTAIIAQLEAMKQNAEASHDPDFPPDTTETPATTTLDELTATLRGPDTLRRAILLREILGAPLGLR